LAPSLPWSAELPRRQVPHCRDTQSAHFANKPGGTPARLEFRMTERTSSSVHSRGRVVCAQDRSRNERRCIESSRRGHATAVHTVLLRLEKTGHEGSLPCLHSNRDRIAAQPIGLSLAG